MPLFYAQSYGSDSNTVAYNLEHASVKTLEQTIDQVIASIPQSSPNVKLGISFDINQQIKNALHQLKTEVPTRLCTLITNQLEANATPEQIMDAIKSDIKILNLSLIDNISLFTNDQDLTPLIKSITACANEAETYVANQYPDFTSNSPRLV